MAHKLKIEIEVDDKGRAVVRRFGENLDHAAEKGERGFKKANRALGRFKNNLIPTTGLVTKLGAAFVAWKLADIARGFLNTAASMERYQTILGTVLHSTERAAKMMQEITKFAATTPFEISGLVEAATRLEAYHLDAMKYMRTLGDTAAAMGKPIMAAVEMVADASQGEFERMKEFGLRATDLAAAAGFKTVQEMTSTRDNLIKATDTLMSMLEARYAGGMENLSKTWGGMMSNMSDLWTQYQQAVMEGGVFDFLRAGIAMVLEELNTLKQEGRLDEWAQEQADAVINIFEIIIYGAATVGEAFRGWQMIWEGLKMAFGAFGAAISAGLIELLEISKRVVDAVAPGKSGSIGAAIIEVTIASNYFNEVLQKSAASLVELASKDSYWKRAGELIGAVKEKGAEYAKTLDDEAKPAIVTTTEETKKLAQVTDKALEKMQSGFGEAAKAHQEAFDKMEAHTEHFLERVQDRTSDFLYDIYAGTIDSWDDMLGRMKDLFLRYLAELTAQAIARPVVVPVLYGLGKSLGLPGMPAAGAKSAAMPGGGIVEGGLMSKGWKWLSGLGAAGAGAAGAGVSQSALAKEVGSLAYQSQGGAAAGTQGFMAAAAPYLTAAGLGYLGYTTIGKALGLPQGQYSGLGAAGGAAAGLAIGGPIGAGIGALVGGVGGSFLGGGPERAGVGGKFSLGPTGASELYNLEDIQGWIWRQPGISADQATQMTQTAVGQAISPYQQIYAMLGKEYQEAVNRHLNTLAWNMEVSSKSGKAPQYFQEELAKLTEQIDASLSQTFTGVVQRAGFDSIEALVEHSQKMEAVARASAQIIGTAFRDAVDTGDWTMFEENIKASIYENVLTGMTEAFMETAVFRQTLEPLFMTLQEAFEKSFVNGEFKASRFRSLVLPEMEGLGDMLTEIRPVFDVVAEMMNSMRMALGYSGEPGSYHAGGMITAHKGVYIGPELRPDERLVKAQVGEGFLSHMGVATIGGRTGLDAINAGKPPGSAATNFHFHLNGIVTTDDVDTWISDRIDRVNRYHHGKSYATVDISRVGLDI